MTKRATKTKTPKVKAGRPLIGDELMKPHSFRMTDDQFEKVGRLGGSEWVRKKIDTAKDPADK